MKKVIEELNELKYEVEAEKNTSRMEDEFGDLLFALINYARFVGINPEDALERTNRKFINRFQFIETESANDGFNIQDMSLDEMESYWLKAKSMELTPKRTSLTYQQCSSIEKFKPRF